MPCHPILVPSTLALFMGSRAYGACGLASPRDGGVVRCRESLTSEPTLGPEDCNAGDSQIPRAAITEKEVHP